MDKHRLFEIEFDVLNTGFSNAERVEIYIEGLVDFEVYRILSKGTK